MVQIKSLDLAANYPQHAIYLNKEKVVHADLPNGAWYFDTGANIHMIIDESALITLNKSVQGTVRFGDASIAKIHGKGTIMVQCDTREPLHALKRLTHPQLMKQYHLT